jgi:ketosteroid isomerase-like protein
MVMRTVAVTVSLTLILVAALLHAQQKTDPALDKLAAEFSAAFSAKDATRVSAFYTDDALLMPPGQLMIKGRENIESYFRRGFGQDFISMEVTPLESAVGSTFAFEAGRSRMVLGSGPGPGGPASTETGKYLLVYKRVGSQWKIAYDIFNGDR